MRASERREEIIEMLVEEQHITMNCLAERFNVTRRTILNDIQLLALKYPIYTICGKYDGGVYIKSNYKLDKDYLTSEQENVLQNVIREINSSYEKEVILNILNKFGRKPIKEQL